jgi:hypothetical protein
MRYSVSPLHRTRLQRPPACTLHAHRSSRRNTRRPVYSRAGRCGRRACRSRGCSSHWDRSEVSTKGYPGRCRFPCCRIDSLHTVCSSPRHRHRRLRYCRAGRRHSCRNSRLGRSAAYSYSGRWPHRTRRPPDSSRRCRCCRSRRDRTACRRSRAHNTRRGRCTGWWLKRNSSPYSSPLIRSGSWSRRTDWAGCCRPGRSNCRCSSRCFADRRRHWGCSYRVVCYPCHHHYRCCCCSRSCGGACDDGASAGWHPCAA